MSLKTYKGIITKLLPNEVFVFGANKQGFHGAGSAGYASFGESGNVWRKNDYGNNPNGWLGMWNEKGKVGLQRGREGLSYGLVTVTRAGAKRSISRHEFIRNIQELYACCDTLPQHKFYFAQTSKPGLNGYDPIELAEFFLSATDGYFPNNLHFEESFAQLIKEQQCTEE